MSYRADKLSSTTYSRNPVTNGSGGTTERGPGLLFDAYSSSHSYNDGYRNQKRSSRNIYPSQENNRHRNTDKISDVSNGRHKNNNHKIREGIETSVVPKVSATSVIE